LKNIVFLHLESISRQRLATFAAAFPNTLRLMQEAIVFDNYFSSATSTVMVLTYLFHANDFELDTSMQFDGAEPARNNRNLFEILQQRGYHAHLVCLNAFPARPIKLSAWGSGLPPVWETNDFPQLFAHFDALTDAPPFAIYVWDLISHVEHSMALAPYANGLTDQLRRACAVADDAVGVIRDTLERKGLLDDTIVVLYGDHGDDFWTHGYKGGMIHGTEPYTDIIAAPFAIRDPDHAPGLHTGLASTIDIAPTCLALLGVDPDVSFAHSGVDLLQRAPDVVYAQNFTANQPDNAGLGIAKAFSVTDDTYTLMASSRGVELFAHRLDPGNHCNLLHLFGFDAAGHLALQEFPGTAGHFLASWSRNPQAVARLAHDFERLRSRLETRIDAKRSYIVERGVDAANALDRHCLATISARGREAFFGAPASAPATRRSVAAFEYAWKLQ
jgi:hypothetical protein